MTSIISSGSGYTPFIKETNATHHIFIIQVCLLILLYFSNLNFILFYKNFFIQQARQRLFFHQNNANLPADRVFISGNLVEENLYDRSSVLYPEPIIAFIEFKLREFFVRFFNR